jgi:hypothetical protein
MRIDPNDSIVEGAAIRRPTLSLDIGLYEGFLADSTLAEADKRALLESLWQIIVGFVDLGFDVRPADKAGEKTSDSAENLTGMGFFLVESALASTTKQFAKAADCSPGSSAESRER